MQRKSNVTRWLVGCLVLPSFWRPGGPSEASQVGPGAFRLNRAIDLSSCTVHEMGDSSTVESSDGAAGGNGDAMDVAFEIRSAEKSFILLARDSASRHLWVTAIRAAVARVIAKRDTGAGEDNTGQQQQHVAPGAGDQPLGAPLGNSWSPGCRPYRLAPPKKPAQSSE